MLILYPGTSLNSFNGSNTCFVDSLAFSVYNMMSPANRSFYFFLSSLHIKISPCLTAASGTWVLPWSGESTCPCLVAYHREKLSVSLLSIMQAVDFSHTVFILLSQFRSFPSFFSVFNCEKVLFSCSVISNSLLPHGLQHARLPCPSPSPGACENSCPSSRWCHPTISSSVVPFSSCLQSFPASGSFLVSWLFASGDQSTGASASVLPLSIQDGFPLGLNWLLSNAFFASADMIVCMIFPFVLLMYITLIFVCWTTLAFLR